jgi:hypothetical protein
MNCPNCGHEIRANQAFCTKCGSPVRQPAPPPFPPATERSVRSDDVADKVKAASTDALNAFKKFAVNPVGGLLSVYESLDKQRAMTVGIVFGAVFVLCLILGIIFTALRFTRPGVVDILRTLIMGVVVFFSIVGASAFARKVFGGAGSIESDCFIGGASLLPMGLFALLASLIGFVGFEIITVLFVFAMCYTVLILYTGCTQISQIPDSRAALAVSAMLSISMLVARIILPRIL